MKYSGLQIKVDENFVFRKSIQLIYKNLVTVGVKRKHIKH